MDWYSYDSAGRSRLAQRTYHNVEDRWYLRLPEAWVDQIWISRAVSGDESGVTFYRLTEEGPRSFLRITAITGSNRETRAARSGRFLLSRQSEIIYTGELLEANDGWESGVTADAVREAFSLITPEWTAGDY